MSREMNDFERALALTLGPEALTRLQQVKLGIAGAGGLGSNCAQFLVRSGFRNLKLVDFDRVEHSNLNRQFFFLDQVGKPKVEALKENLLRINPHLHIETHAEKITTKNVKDLFRDCQAVIEALDRPEFKKMVVEAYLSAPKLLVAASGLAGWGRSDGIGIQKIKEHFFLVGDGVSEVTADCPAMAPGVVVAAAKQADVVLQYFLNHKKGQ